jgi:hypothetical protein
MPNRCDKHKIFIGKDGCKICNELQDLRNEYHAKCHELIVENEQLREKIKKLESKDLSDDIKQAIHYLSRNEKPIFTNLFAAESIIASVWDLYLQIPEKRREHLKPFIDKVMSFCDTLNVFNTALAEKASKAMGNAEYQGMIIETIRVLDASSGKIKNCEVCIHALLRKTIIKKELNKNRT